jgi:hypothetical protein
VGRRLKPRDLEEELFQAKDSFVLWQWGVFIEECTRESMEEQLSIRSSYHLIQWFSINFQHRSWSTDVYGASHSQFPSPSLQCPRFSALLSAIVRFDGTSTISLNTLFNHLLNIIDVVLCIVRINTPPPGLFTLIATYNFAGATRVIKPGRGYKSQEA